MKKVKLAKALCAILIICQFAFMRNEWENPLL